MLLLQRGAGTQARLASCVKKYQEQFTYRDAQRITLYSDGRLLFLSYVYKHVRVVMLRMQDDIVAVNKPAGMAVHGERSYPLHMHSSILARMLSWT